jgi:tetratricopeptide (TPR) repeat protein
MSLLSGRSKKALAQLNKVGARWLAGDPQARLWRADALRNLGRNKDAATIYHELLETRYAPAARLGLAEQALARGRTVAALAMARKSVNQLNDRGVHSLTHQVRAGLLLAPLPSAAGRHRRRDYRAARGARAIARQFQR